MESKSGGRGFWTSLPGILTGIAGVLAAVGTIMGVVLSQGDSAHTSLQVSPSVSSQSWGDQADAICAAAVRNGSGFVSSNPFNSQLPAAASFAANWQSVDDQLRKLPADDQQQGTVSDMLTYWDKAIVMMQAAIQSAENGDYTTEQQDLSSLNTLTTEGNTLANQLAAGTCASGAF